jgi:hypothetical protein
MFAVLRLGILQGVERTGSVYSIMPQWWHLMVLQYVAASFHLPSVSTANINTVQYPTPYQHCEIPAIPVLLISKVLLHQSNITTAFVHSHSNLFSDVFPALPTYSNHNIIQYAVLFSMAASCRPPQTPAQNVQLPTYNNTFNILMPHLNVVITLFN